MQHVILWPNSEYHLFPTLLSLSQSWALIPDPEWWGLDSKIWNPQWTSILWVESAPIRTECNTTRAIPFDEAVQVESGILLLWTSTFGICMKSSWFKKAGIISCFLALCASCIRFYLDQCSLATRMPCPCPFYPVIIIYAFDPTWLTDGDGMLLLPFGEAMVVWLN